MELRPISHCPACGEHLSVRRLQCDTCKTVVEGQFSPSRFDLLTKEQQQFIEVFLVARGNIKEVERVLGISYPTVRNRLDNVLQSMGYPVEKDEPTAEQRGKILSAIDKGELSVTEAIKLLRGESDE